MGIVFEPMYDPQQPSHQRGVRICDLPRTGAAALSRQLQIGDELLSINDTTVSRLGFDEIMDFIIEADPEAVQLLFRRPRKESRSASSQLAKETSSPKIKWVDDEKQKSSDRPRKERKSRKKRKEVVPEDETLGTLTEGEESYGKSRSSRSSRGKKHPYESESFLDLLIDTICTNSSNVCRDTFRRADSFSDEDTLEDDTLGSDRDESTYVTYEESLDNPRRKKNKAVSPPTETQKRPSPRQRSPSPVRVPSPKVVPEPEPVPVPEPAPEPSPVPAGNPAAPIQEVEYDDRVDHGADVSVMDSLGGPSLLIDRKKQMVPQEVMDRFGRDYPNQFGMSRVDTIQADPLKYYTYVVKSLLEEHEPEKVRLLDKLLAKYKGREDHLVQKLSVRYQAQEQKQQESEPEEPPRDMEEFAQTVQANKNGLVAQNTINTAKHRLDEQDWPKEEKKDDFVQDDIPEEEEEEEEESENEDEEDSYDQVDGTSPAVIAQVSELLNYVYGKTSVPGQIDRVSTIMRAYEGREAVLLELLETKALLKANKEKENADPLPAFLRQAHEQEVSPTWEGEQNDLPPVTPMAHPSVATPAANTTNATNTLLQDDISSMSGVSSPAAERDPPSPQDEFEVQHESFSNQPEEPQAKQTSPGQRKHVSTTPKPTVSKKKKGLFGGLFKKKASATPNRTTRGKNHRKLKGVTSGEGSI